MVVQTAGITRDRVKVVGKSSTLLSAQVHGLAICIASRLRLDCLYKLSACASDFLGLEFLDLLFDIRC
jgi:hypothetical protein